jgi:hypothetical protein
MSWREHPLGLREPVYFPVINMTMHSSLEILP